MRKIFINKTRKVHFYNPIIKIKRTANLKNFITIFSGYFGLNNQKKWLFKPKP